MGRINGSGLELLIKRKELKNMEISKFKNQTVITAERGKYLKLKGNEESENIIGKPIRIIFDNSKEIPELEESDIIL